MTGGLFLPRCDLGYSVTQCLWLRNLGILSPGCCRGGVLVGVLMEEDGLHGKDCLMG